jgi:hypothetical protein
MELQNSREYKAVQELERALNDMGWSPKRFAESTRFYHLTAGINANHSGGYPNGR